MRRSVYAHVHACVFIYASMRARIFVVLHVPLEQKFNRLFDNYKVPCTSTLTHIFMDYAYMSLNPSLLPVIFKYRSFSGAETRRRTNMGSRAFHASAPKEWIRLCSSDSLPYFKKRL